MRFCYRLFQTVSTVFVLILFWHALAPDPWCWLSAERIGKAVFPFLAYLGIMLIAILYDAVRHD